MILKIIVMILSGILFSLGGYNWHNARRFILPTLLAISAWLLSHSLWSLSLLSCCGSFCLGYGENSPLKHCFGDGWGRGVWGLLSGLSLSLALFLTHHISLFYFLAYLVLNFTLENSLKKVNQIVGDFIIGMGFGLLVLLIH